MSGSYAPVSSAFTPPQDCTCSCSCTQSAGVSPHPVRYFNGEIRLTVDDLPSPGFGMAWGHQRTYSNQLSSNADFGNGYNWLVDQWSHIVEFEDSSVEVLFNPLLAYWFDLVDGEYVARFGAKQTLTQVYDAMGRGNMTTTPSGTIVRTVYDLRDQVIPTWVGTNDTDETDTDPSDSGTPPNNMLCVRQNQFDGGNPAGDGLLTQTTDWVDVDNSRVMTFGYDWRDRQTSVAGALSYFILRTFDNLDRVTQLNRMDTSASGSMLTQSTTTFDDIGRVYQTAIYEVVSGTASNPQTSNNWYDLSGNLIKSQPAGSSAWVKMTYDGVSRTTASYVGYSTGTVNYAEAGSVAESIVFEQTFTTFDEASNVIEIDSYQRDYNAPTGTVGPLNGPGGSDPTARVTFVVIYPDGIGRTLNTADYGTNGNSSFSRPNTCGTRSASLLITTNVYDQTGVIVQIVDPAATVTNQVFDDAGRRTSLVLNYISGGTGADQNQTTNWTYNPDSNVLTMTAVNADTENQVTTYGYGITVAGGSTLNSNSPLQSVTYPDSGTVTVQYNRQGV
jgi:hypothetical protein